jgi:hypothetical protein
MMNGLQALGYWKTCKSLVLSRDFCCPDKINRLRQPVRFQTRTPQCNSVGRVSLLLANCTESSRLDWSTEKYPYWKSHRCPWSWASVRCQRHWHVYCWTFLQYIPLPCYLIRHTNSFSSRVRFWNQRNC